MPKTFYVTTPIYYVNAEPHLGHAYTTIVADVLTRFHRLIGEDAFFLTGTDEHGDKIMQAAQKAGEDPKTYVDRISNIFRNTWPALNVQYSKFIRTTDPEHQAVVQQILQNVYDKGDIYFGEYGGMYCFGCERFYTEREMVDGMCPDHKAPLQLINEENYFFRMSRYQEWLIDKIRGNPEFIQPERYRNEVLSFLKEPLEDLCISRPKSRLQWGISLPFDDRYVTYVWFDALINYISALGYPDGENFGKYWKESHHLIAKDILKPHGIYWPCMLKAAGIEPYRNLHVHGYWNVNESKMSKTVGNVTEPLKLKDVYGLDAFRYFLMREMVFGLDSNFSEDALIQRINSDLANDLGNLFSRSAGMLKKYFKGLVPKPSQFDAPDDELAAEARKVRLEYIESMNRFAFHKALMAVWELINHVNRYIDYQAPWVLHKEARLERLSTVMAATFGTIHLVSLLIAPFMPDTSEEMRSRMGLDLDSTDPIASGKFDFESLIPVGNSVIKANALFPRVEKFEEKAPAGQAKPSIKTKAPISIKDFMKIDLRTGVITHAEPVPNSDKLLKLFVDIGELRTVVSGIARHYSPTDLIGKQVVIVVNLEPAKLMGIESQGMILACEHGKDLFLATLDSKASPGDPVL